MRTELSQLVGQRVIITADLQKTKTISRNRNYWCMTDCSIYIYNQNRKLDLTKPSATTEHLWVSGDDRQLEDMDGAIWSGVVEEYSRKDGTTDYGVEITQTLYLPLLRRQVISLSNVSPTQLPLGLLKECLNHITEALEEDYTLINIHSNKTARTEVYDLKARLSSLYATAKSAQRVSYISPGKGQPCVVTGLHRQVNLPTQQYPALKQFVKL